LRQGPKARSTKQKARLQRIDALLEAPARQGRTSLAMAATARRIGKRAITAEGLAVAVGDRTLLRSFSYDFSPEDRVGIIGPNGVGKSSLLEVIAGRRPPSEGLLELGATVKLAYFDQHSDVLLAKDGKRKVIEVVQEAASRVQVDGMELTASQLLERFLFPPAQQHQPVAKLSGGERRRLHLCRLLIEAPNVLLLDEPTNDLDVHTLSVLEEFLDDFRGCVVVVSHDRWFLDRTVDRLFHFEAGRLERFEGNYSSWLERRSGASAPAPVQALAPGPAGVGRETALPSTSPAKGLAAGPRRRSFKEARELERLETELPELEQRRRELEQHLASPSGPDYARLEELTHELAALVERIDAAEERWLALSELAA
jgi:ATP-binding cassette subfamily F protein uup